VVKIQGLRKVKCPWWSKVNPYAVLAVLVGTGEGLTHVICCFTCTNRCSERELLCWSVVKLD